MLSIRDSLVVISLATVLACPVLAWSQTDQTNPAVDLLLRAQLQYQNFEFAQARKTLWQAHEVRSELTAAQQRMLAERLAEVDQAIAGKAAAEAVFKQAQTDKQAGKYTAAREGFAQAAVSPYLKPAIRTAARQELARTSAQESADKPALAETPTFEIFDEQAAPSPAMAASAEPDTEPVLIEQAPQEPILVDESDQAVPVVAAEASEQPAKPNTEMVEISQADNRDVPAPRQETETLKTKPVDSLMQQMDSTPAPASSVEVESLMAKGRTALNQNQPEKAVQYFEQALRKDPDNAAARKQLNLARMQTAQPGSTAILPEFIKRRRVEKQMVEQDYQQALKKSMEIMVARPNSEQEFESAEQSALRAKAVVQNNKRLFADTEYRGKIARADDQIAYIKEKLTAWQQQRVAAQRQKIEAQERQRQRGVIQQKEKKVAELTSRARVLWKSEQYQQALQVLQEIVELEPNNLWAQENIYMMKRFVQLQQQWQQVTDSNQQLSKLRAENESASIPWYDLLRYPKSWVTKTEQRRAYAAGVSSESIEDRRVNKALDQVIARIPFQDKGVEFQYAIDWFRDATGINIYVNWGTLETEEPNIRQNLIDLQLSNVKAETVLQRMLSNAGGGIVEIGYVIVDGVINIDLKRRLDEMTYPRVYDILDLLDRPANFTGPRVDLSSLADSTSTSSSGGGGGGTSIWGDDTETESEGEDVTRAQARQMLIDLVKKSTGDPEVDWYPAGPGSIDLLVGTGNLVVKQTAAKHRLIQDLISKLRESTTIQVSVEARFLEVETGYLNQIGVDLNMYFNIGSNINQTDPAVIDVGTGATVPSNSPSTWAGRGWNGGHSFNKLSPIGVTQGNGNTFANMLDTGGGATAALAQGIATQIPGSAMTIAGTFLDDIQVDFLIRATQAHSLSRVLTAPRLTLMNGGKAFISINVNQQYISGYDVTVAESSVGYEPIISSAQTGTMLQVEAIVSHDRRYVKMRLEPQIVTLDNDPTGGLSSVDLIGADTEGSFPLGLPRQTVQEIRTKVSVPDGGTLLIGGQRLSGEVEREMGVPVVSKLPVVNRAFTNKGKTRDERTLLILVKPTILINDEQERDPRLHSEEPTYVPGFD